MSLRTDRKILVTNMKRSGWYLHGRKGSRRVGRDWRLSAPTHTRVVVTGNRVQDGQCDAGSGVYLYVMLYFEDLSTSLFDLCFVLILL